MAEICPHCGLPKELCVCETIAKESQEISICLENKKFGKMVALSGIKIIDVPIEEAIKELKTVDMELYGIAKVFFG
jgi:translation initiation factor 1